jgi:hypothetical protein
MKLLLAISIGLPIAIVIVTVIYFMMMIGWVLVLTFFVILLVSGIYVGLTKVPIQTKKKAP